MKTSRASWALLGVVVGAAGLATSYLASSVMNQRLSPVTAVAELIIKITPGGLVEALISLVGTNDKPFLVAGILIVMALLLALIGVLTRSHRWAPFVGYGLLTAVGAVATLTTEGAVATDLIPVAVGLGTWMLASSVLSERLRRLDAAAATSDPSARASEAGRARRDPASNRRSFLVGVGVVAGIAALSGVGGRLAGGARRRVDQARRLLRLPEVSLPTVPADVSVGVDEVASWMTPARDFYLIDTAIIKPNLEPADWRLRIHGLVDNPIEIGYDELVSRGFVEGWVTLCCVSNEVGGGLIGNAWWSGVSLQDLIEEAGPQAGADAVLQTSVDGWTCGTPLEALTDGRNAMLAVAMNGDPLPIEHGFPVRSIVPGLYGYVSATKWVVDMEVTRFADISAYWTERGWGEMGPIKISSRVEKPYFGEGVTAGELVVAGTAWAQHTGIESVDVSIDGGAWQPATLGGVPNDDTWVQWAATVQVDEGEHEVRSRATDKDGLVQTTVVRGVLPDGATGLHTVGFSATSRA